MRSENLSPQVMSALEHLGWASIVAAAERVQAVAFRIRLRVREGMEQMT